MNRTVATAALLILAGCGYPGPPLPPALNIPQPVTDLRVEQTGSQIIVRFTPPAQTTEKLPADLRAVTLYVGPGEAEFSADRWGAAARRYSIPLDAMEHAIPAADWVGQQVILSLRTTGRTGRESDWSNFQLLAVGTPLLTPAVSAVESVPDGVAVRWEGNAPRYQVLRAILNAPEPKLELIGETEAPEYVDRSTVYGARYRYVILGLAGEARRSLPSAPVEFVPTDTFPPAIPSGLTAAAGPASIDLSWARNTEDDFAGFRLFRAVGDGPFEPLPQLLLLPAFTDRDVRPGLRYRYTISALDTAGNESARSAEASAQIE